AANRVVAGVGYGFRAASAADLAHASTNHSGPQANGAKGNIEIDILASAPKKLPNSGLAVRISGNNPFNGGISSCSGLEKNASGKRFARSSHSLSPALYLRLADPHMRSF